MPDLVEDTEQRVVLGPTESGDHDRYAHFVPADQIADAMVYGIALVALCGKRWVPTRDGLKFPICPECKEVWEGLSDD